MKDFWKIVIQDFGRREGLAEQGYRIGFTALFWIVAICLGSLVLSKQVQIPSLEGPLMAFIEERISAPMLVFQMVILVFVMGFCVLVPIQAFQEEAVGETFRLWYTLGAAAGAISLLSSHFVQSFVFYITGVALPWFIYASDFRREMHQVMQKLTTKR